MKYYLGIDLGTSSIKLSLADEKGNILDSASKDYPLYLPKGIILVLLISSSNPYLANLLINAL